MMSPEWNTDHPTKETNLLLSGNESAKRTIGPLVPLQRGLDPANGNMFLFCCVVLDAVLYVNSKAPGLKLGVLTENTVNTTSKYGNMTSPGITGTPTYDPSIPELRWKRYKKREDGLRTIQVKFLLYSFVYTIHRLPEVSINQRYRDWVSEHTSGKEVPNWQRKCCHWHWIVFFPLYISAYLQDLSLHQKHIN